MTYLIVNTSKAEGSVKIGNTFKTIRAGDRITSDVAPTSWTRELKVIRQLDVSSPVKPVSRSRSKSSDGSVGEEV